LLAAVREDAANLADAAAGRLDLAVPSCPGRDPGRLVGHVGRVHRMAIGAVSSDSTAPPEGKPEKPPEGPEVVDWFRTGAAELIQLLAAADPERPAWNFTRAHHQVR